MRLLLAALLLVNTVFETSAHSWYHSFCCHQNDCAPVSRVTLDEQGELIYTTPFGSAKRDLSTTILPSQDANYHACIRDGKLLCIYIPPNT